MQNLDRIVGHVETTPENKRALIKSQMRKERASFLGQSGKVAPFGETFSKLTEAVAFKSKPIAEFDHAIYDDYQEIFDKRLRKYGLEKIDDPTHRHVWFFKPQNQKDAIERISEFNQINDNEKKRGYLTFEDHRRKGELLGYSEGDINGFLSWRALMILRNYAMTGKAEWTYCPLRTALPAVTTV